MAIKKGNGLPIFLMVLVLLSAFNSHNFTYLKIISVLGCIGIIIHYIDEK